MEQTHNDKFYSLLKDFRTAMLITNSSKGLCARPMALAGIETNCEIWLITDSHSAKVDELSEFPQVHITCQNEHDSYLSLSGIATTSQDRQKIKALWKEPFRVWFPEGAEDPQILLIHIIPQRAEYWDNTGYNKAKYLFQAVKAYVTGTKPEVKNEEQHGTVRF